MESEEVCLILGGAGYIGSFVTHDFATKFSNVVVIDNFSNGHRKSIEMLPVIIIEGNINNKLLLSEVFEKYKPTLVIHLCASAIVGESMQNPFEYYRNNVDDFLTLAECMRNHECKKIIFSSTCAVFGIYSGIPTDEHEKIHPINPYGESKQICEFLLRWLDKIYNIKHVILRYFNVAGGSMNGKIGEDHRHETHLIPLILQVASGIRNKIYVFGHDYPTRDGTCIRDYIHVIDIAHAHLHAANYLTNGGKSDDFNLGIGKGYSVLEVIDICRKITMHSIPTEIVSPRSGDAIEYLSSSIKATNILGWIPQYPKLEDIIKSAWIFHSMHLNGYED